jgi:hypothetical protein
MRFIVVFFLALLTAVVNAHFQLQFPPPRGPFNAPDEVKFCGASQTFATIYIIHSYLSVPDGYPNAASNRTLFPLSGGYITLKTGHPNWTCRSYSQSYQNVEIPVLTSFNSWSTHFHLPKPNHLCRIHFDQWVWCRPPPRKFLSPARFFKVQCDWPAIWTKRYFTGRVIFCLLCTRFEAELILFAKQIVFLGGDGNLYQASEMAALLSCESILFNLL